MTQSNMQRERSFHEAFKNRDDLCLSQNDDSLCFRDTIYIVDRFWLRFLDRNLNRSFSLRIPRFKSQNRPCRLCSVSM